MRAIEVSGTSMGWEINCYQHCQHGCLYCYARTMEKKTYGEWIKPEPRYQVVDWLIKDIDELNDIPQLRAQIKDILLCGRTDGYQGLESDYGITREVITILVDHDLPFTVLTKNTNVMRDVEVFKEYDNCRVGFSIITTDDNLRQLLEPNASPIEDRCKSIEKLKEEGVSTYCCIEPIMPDKKSDPIRIVKRLKDYVDLFGFGKWNPYSKKLVKERLGIDYNDEFYLNIFNELIPYCEQEKIKYSIVKHSQQFLRSYGIRFLPTQLVSDIPYVGPNDIVGK